MCEQTEGRQTDTRTLPPHQAFILTIFARNVHITVDRAFECLHSVEVDCVASVPRGTEYPHL